jgi:hypothetical protein
MKLIKVEEHERPNRREMRFTPGKATILVDTETGKLYYCERLREGTLQEIHGWINNPPMDPQE